MGAKVDELTWFGAIALEALDSFMLLQGLRRVEELDPQLVSQNLSLIDDLAGPFSYPIHRILAHLRNPDHQVVDMNPLETDLSGQSDERDQLIDVLAVEGEVENQSGTGPPGPLFGADQTPAVLDHPVEGTHSPHGQIGTARGGIDGNMQLRDVVDRE